MTKLTREDMDNLAARIGTLEAQHDADTHTFDVMLNHINHLEELKAELLAACEAADVAMDGVAQMYGSSLLGTNNPYADQWRDAHLGLQAAIAAVKEF